MPDSGQPFQRHRPPSLWRDLTVGLLLQACILGGGQMLDRWLVPETLCCAPHQVL